jgi:hypothetical protein
MRLLARRQVRLHQQRRSASVLSAMLLLLPVVVLSRALRLRLGAAGAFMRVSGSICLCCALQQRVHCFFAMSASAQILLICVLQRQPA